MRKKKNHIISSIVLGGIGGSITTNLIYSAFNQSEKYIKLIQLINEDIIIVFVLILSSICFYKLAMRHAKIQDYNELCNTYPNGIVKWLRKNEQSNNHVEYSVKLAALSSVKEIIHEEQSVIDEYHEIKENCPHVFSYYKNPYTQMIKTCDKRKKMARRSKKKRSHC